MEALPKTVNGVIINEKNESSYGQVALSAVGSNDVVIKVHSAAINPSDVMFLKGMYPAGKTKPTTAGFEGSGTVVATGDSEAAKQLLNKNVCFFASGKDSLGSWTEYTVQHFGVCVPLPGDLSLEEGATCLVNPLTVQGFINIAETKGYTTIVHNAAASQLGRMLVSGAKLNNITLINFVRRQEQVDILKALGAQYIINTSDQDWKEQTAALFDQLKPQAFFDAIGGETATDIFQLLPNNSTTYNYGALSLRPIQVGAADLIFKGKTLTGYWLSADLQNPQTSTKLFTETFKNLASRSYKTEISARYTLDKYEEAIKFYSANSTLGKVLIQNENF